MKNWELEFEFRQTKTIFRGCDGRNSLGTTASIVYTYAKYNINFIVIPSYYYKTYKVIILQASPKNLFFYYLLIFKTTFVPIFFVYLKNIQNSTFKYLIYTHTFLNNQPNVLGGQS